MKASSLTPLALFIALQAAAALLAPRAPASSPPRFSRTTRLQGRESAYVDQLLEVVEPTDRGVKATPEKRAIVDGLIKRLERSYKGTDAAATPEWLFRETEVVYVGQRDSRRANAAGGKFRGRFGRLLFSTKALYQHVLKEGGREIAVNANRFRFLGLVPGCAVLRGTVAPEEDYEALGRKWNRTLSSNTLRASFERPRVTLGPLAFAVGPPSTVRLDTTYLDERVRISRGGSSGTPFVFKACAGDAGAALWRDVVAKKPVAAAKAGVFVAAAAVLAAVPALKRPPVALAPAGVLGLVALKLLTSTGGIVVEPRDPATKAYANAGYGG
mmetsp:Transcript_1349/g.4039  ORF Transcript_1349/g.4039 Transcript_1349/m.4039 type:complete len:328 (+) Transcript_1349:188-1171(+)